MICCNGYLFDAGGKRVFDVNTSRISYGSGAMAQLDSHAVLLGMHRVAFAGRSDARERLKSALSQHIASLMAQTGMPADLAALSYQPNDIESLVARTLAQTRLLANAPIAVDAAVLPELFTTALAAGHAMPSNS